MGRVVAVAPGEHLTATIMGVHMTYQLVDRGERTRLLLKLASGSGRLLGPLFALGDLVMARKQLLTLKSLAESPR